MESERPQQQRASLCCLYSRALGRASSRQVCIEAEAWNSVQKLPWVDIRLLFMLLVG